MGKYKKIIWSCNRKFGRNIRNDSIEITVPEDVDKKILFNKMKDIGLECVCSKGNKLFFRLIEEKDNYYKSTLNYKNYYNNEKLIGKMNIFDNICDCIKTSRGSVIIKERKDNDKMY